PVPVVKIDRPQVRDVTLWDEYPGRIAAVASVDVRARVDGYLDKVNFKAGDRVNKGDLLFVIDPRPYRTRLSHAQAQLEQARARLDLARNNKARAEHMYRSKAISEEEYDARSKGLLEAEAEVRSAEADVGEAKLNLEFTEVRSPIAGRVGRELITAGNLVKGSGGDGTLLPFIVSVDPVHVYVDVDERSALKYRRLTGQGGEMGTRIPAELALADEQGYPHRGHIDYESPRLDAGTGTLTLRGVFPNPDGLLTPGLFTRMRVPGGKAAQALLLPDRAIGSDLANRFVWVVKADNKVERRPVVLGALSEGLRVVAEGLKPDDRVVIEGVQKLRPDQEVNPETAPAAGSR
ncbi:MAG: efflux RND transporter periplasmic adaptor subunit, partial [Methylococcaceae bacterium]|nr:efflux RND transporter periplasmic adaptor subunit [Methylococcaceae bacterium]